MRIIRTRFEILVREAEKIVLGIVPVMTAAQKTSEIKYAMNAARTRSNLICFSCLSTLRRSWTSMMPNITAQHIFDSA